MGRGVPPSRSGLWTLVNSAEGTARVGIPWAVFNDGGTYGANATAGFVADMVQIGPDRKLKKSEVPLVAYSGDDWHGDLSKAATVTLTFADNTTRTARINIQVSGMVIIVK